MLVLFGFVAEEQVAGRLSSGNEAELSASICPSFQKTGVCILGPKCRYGNLAC